MRQNLACSWPAARLRVWCVGLNLSQVSHAPARGSCGGLWRLTKGVRPRGSGARRASRAGPLRLKNLPAHRTVEAARLRLPRALRPKRALGGLFRLSFKGGARRDFPTSEPAYFSRASSDRRTRRRWANPSKELLSIANRGNQSLRTLLLTRTYSSFLDVSRTCQKFQVIWLSVGSHSCFTLRAKGRCPMVTSGGRSSPLCDGALACAWWVDAPARVAYAYAQPTQSSTRSRQLPPSSTGSPRRRWKELAPAAGSRRVRVGRRSLFPLLHGPRPGDP